MIEGEGSGISVSGAKLELRMTRWMAPDKVRRPVVSEIFRKVRIERGGPGGNAGQGPETSYRGAAQKGRGFAGAGRKGPIERVQQSERIELVSYKQF